MQMVCSLALVATAAASFSRGRGGLMIMTMLAMARKNIHFLYEIVYYQNVCVFIVGVKVTALLLWACGSVCVCARECAATQLSVGQKLVYFNALR